MCSKKERFLRLICLGCMTAGVLGISACSSGKPLTQTEIQASSETLQWLDEQYGFVSNPQVEVFLSRVAKRLGGAVYGTALQTQIGSVDAVYYRNYPWRVSILNTDTINAFSLGAGSVVVTRGMFAHLRSEAEFAAVVSHEFSHQVLGHTRESLEQDDLTDGMPQAVFSLDNELQADALALKILDVARYDIRHAPRALTIDYRPQENRVSGRIPPDWLKLRMARLEQEMERYPLRLPATENTREFTKVWKYLAR